MKFGIGTLYSKLSSKREFREYRVSDIHTYGHSYLRTGVNECLPVLPIFIDRFGQN